MPSYYASVYIVAEVVPQVNELPVVTETSAGVLSGYPHARIVLAASVTEYNTYALNVTVPPDTFQVETIDAGNLKVTEVVPAMATVPILTPPCV